MQSSKIGFLKIFWVFFILVFALITPAETQQLATWERIDPASGFGGANIDIFCLARYNGHLYAGTRNLNGFEVWRFNGSAWSRVANGGLGDPSDQGAWSMAVYNRRLYMGTDNGRVYEFNGSTWTQANIDGFGGAPDRIRCLAADDNYLYAGTDICEVWRYNGINWIRIGSSGLGNPGDNWLARSMAIRGGVLFVGAAGWNFPEVLRYNGTPDDWTVVATGGIDPTENTDAIRSMAVFRGALYAATANFLGNGTQIFRYNNSPGNWTQANQSGFGDPDNMATHSLQAYADHLFAGIISNFGLGTRIYYFNGSIWNQTVNNGFGDIDNYNTAALIEYRNQLYAGVSNGNTGCQVWRSHFFYYISASAPEGHGRVDPRRDRINYGHEISIHMYPDSGYRVGTILDNGVPMSIANPYILTDVNQDHDIEITFTNDPPEVSFVRPLDDAVVSGLTDIEVLAQDDSGISKIDLFINGVQVHTESGASTLTYTWDTITYMSGIHSLRAVARDTSGLSGEAQITVTLQNILLNLQTSRVTEKAWIVKKDFGRLQFSADNRGAVPIGKFVVYRKEGNGGFQKIGEINPVSGSSNYTYNDGTIQPNLTYTYKIEVVDVNGKVVAVSNEATI